MPFLGPQQPSTVGSSGLCPGPQESKRFLRRQGLCLCAPSNLRLLRPQQHSVAGMFGPLRPKQDDPPALNVAARPWRGAPALGACEVALAAARRRGKPCSEISLAFLACSNPPGLACEKLRFSTSEGSSWLLWTSGWSRPRWRQSDGEQAQCGPPGPRAPASQGVCCAANPEQFEIFIAADSNCRVPLLFPSRRGMGSSCFKPPPAFCARRLLRVFRAGRSAGFDGSAPCCTTA